MSSPLEKFILENRDKFDSEIQGSGVWEKIQEKMSPEKPKQAVVRSLPFRRWLAAAAMLLFVGLAALLYYTLQKPKPQQETATNNLPSRPVEDTTRSKPNVEQQQIALTPSVSPEKASKDLTEKLSKNNPVQSTTDEVDNKEMYYYAKLIEIKHAELKTLEKDEPLLYRQFSGDVQKLDSVYHSLKTQLPSNSNREQVIEAMISNLQLQIGLLNKQLDIIKKIKHSKKSAYEKAYKSV